MNPFVAFILGLLIGWLIEWVIDWLYWRRWGQPAVRTEGLESDRARIADLEQEIASYKSQLASLQSEAARSVSARVPVASMPAANMPAAEAAPVTGVRSAPGVIVSPDAAGVQAQAEEDDLLGKIVGMTSELARRLREAGVRTFAALGALKPARLREIAGDELHEPAAVADIIRQARLNAGTMKKVDDLEIIVGIGPVIARMLNNAGIFTFADLAALNESELRDIVGARIEHLANEGQIISQARQLAEQQQ